MKQEVIGIILDGQDVVHFVAYYIIMGTGAICFFVLDVWRSVKSSQNTPGKLHFGYLVRDNIPRALIIPILLAVAVLFFEDIYGVPINRKLAFTQGFQIDVLIGMALKFAKDKGPLKKHRENLNKRYGNN